jgi:hypothetical protein
MLNKVIYNNGMYQVEVVNLGGELHIDIVQSHTTRTMKFLWTRGPKWLNDWVNRRKVAAVIKMADNKKAHGTWSDRPDGVERVYNNIHTLVPTTEGD